MRDSPEFREEHREWVTEYFSLVVDVFQNIFGPFHEVADFVTGRRSVDAPFQFLFHLLAQNVLENEQFHYGFDRNCFCLIFIYQDHCYSDALLSFNSSFSLK